MKKFENKVAVTHYIGQNKQCNDSCVTRYGFYCSHTYSILLPSILIQNSIVVGATCFLSRPRMLWPKSGTSDLLEF